MRIETRSVYISPELIADSLPEPMDDNHPSARISSIGDTLHNLSCEHQDTELGDILSQKAMLSWRLSKCLMDILQDHPNICSEIIKKIKNDD